MIKAKDIYNAYLHIGYELYVIIPNELENQTITLTYKGKDYQNQTRTLLLKYLETFTRPCGELVKRDIKNSNNQFFLNLKARNSKLNIIYGIADIDKINEFELLHFEIDKETEHLIFVFKLKGTK